MSSPSKGSYFTLSRFFCYILCFIITLSSCIFPLSNSIVQSTPSLDLSPRSLPRDEDNEPNNELQDANFLDLKVDENSYIFGNFSITDNVDWYKFHVSTGDPPGKSSDRFYFSLSDVNTNTGVYMELYSSLPWPLKLAQSTVHDKDIMDQNPALIEMVAPLNDTFFLKILPNGTPIDIKETYVLSYGIIKEDNNAAFDDDNSFSSPMVKWVDPTSEAGVANDYLSAIWDVHDFFNFTGYENQSLEIILIPPDEGDFDLFLYKSKTIIPLASSENRGFGSSNEEKITIILPEDNEYFIRVLAKINNTGPELNNLNRGYYNLYFSGNVPPRWKSNAKTHYDIIEDTQAVYINPEDLWVDINKYDKLVFLLWNYSTLDWDLRDENEKVVSDILYDNFRIQIMNNGTPQYPMEVIKIIPLENRYGTTEVKLGAYDIPLKAYTEKNITIHITPVNDPPIIYDTIQWLDLKETAVLGKDKITIFEFNTAQIKVQAHDPDGDLLTFSAEFIDNTVAFAKEFKLDPQTGIIEFYADYKYIGSYEIIIKVIDNGTSPDHLETTKLLTIKIISLSDRAPKTKLLNPINGSTVKSLNPTFIWNVSDLDSPNEEITYEIFISSDINKILTLSNDALILSISNINQFTLQKPLKNLNVYYWTIIPNDGIFRGHCENGFQLFNIDTGVFCPEVNLVSPPNKMLLNYTNIELNWKVNNTKGNDALLKFDIYFGQDPNQLLRIGTRTITNYIPKGIEDGHTYYWQIVPVFGTGPDTVEGVRSPIWSFSISKNYKPPSVILEFPRDNSILKDNSFWLSWKVNYNGPEVLNYMIYISTSPEFTYEPYSTVIDSTYLKLTNMEVRTYYWKVIPFINEIPGFESKTWSFKIYPNVVQPIAVPKAPKENSTVTETIIELKWTIEYSGSVAKVRYDVYLDNSTNDPAEMRLLKKDHRQLFYNVELKDHETYYWRVVPTINIEDGVVLGEFKGIIGIFKVNSSYRPELNPKYNISLNKSIFKLSSGNSVMVELLIKNEGNVDLTFNVSCSIEPDNFLTINHEQKLIEVSSEESYTFTFWISAPENIKNNIFLVTVECFANELNESKKEILTIEITNEEPGAVQVSMINSYSALIIVFLIIFGLIIFSFFYRRHFKMKKSVNDVSELPEDTNVDRVSIAIPSISQDLESKVESDENRKINESSDYSHKITSESDNSHIKHHKNIETKTTNTRFDGELKAETPVNNNHMISEAPVKMSLMANPQTLPTTPALVKPTATFSKHTAALAKPVDKQK